MTCCLICYEDWKPIFSAHESAQDQHHHYFHKECLGEWYKLTAAKHQSWKCPLCSLPLSGSILYGLNGTRRRPPKALNLALWLALLASDYEKVQGILEDGLKAPETLSDDILDTCYAFAIGQDRPVLLGILDRFCGNRASPCLAYAINHNQIDSRAREMIEVNPRRALQLALMLRNVQVLEMALELTRFRVSTDFWYLYQAIVQKKWKVMLKPVLAKASPWASLRIRTKLWWLCKRKSKIDCVL